MTKETIGLGFSLSGKVKKIVFVKFNDETYTHNALRRIKDSWITNILDHQKRFAKVVKFYGQFKSSLIPQDLIPNARDRSFGFPIKV